jgi:hypothetical protein
MLQSHFGRPWNLNRLAVNKNLSLLHCTKIDKLAAPMCYGVAPSVLNNLSPIMALSIYTRLNLVSLVSLIASDI